MALLRRQLHGQQQMSFNTTFVGIFFLLLCRLSFTYAAVFSCTGGSVYFVAHPDDDLLFQSPDMITDYQTQACITTIYLTSGDSGIGIAYAQSRENGAEAAMAEIAGVSDSWTQFSAIFGGQPVLVRTLIGAPQVQKVWFELPDGDVDGSGYPSTGYETLRTLYFGNIASITNLNGTATYTLATLQQAVQEIMTARQPARVRTLDYLSQYDAGDHSDHLTVARIVNALAGSYAPSASVSGYMGYPIQNLAPTLSTSSSAFLAKTNAFFAYTPYDTSECQSFSACSSAGRGEAYWLPRQYVVTQALAEQSSTYSAQTPVTFPSGINVAPLAVPTASSSASGQPPQRAIDGVIAGYPGNASAEWVSNGGLTGTWFELTWPQTYNITAIVLYDRPNLYDSISGGTLTFSGGTVISFGQLNNDGSATVINLPQPVLTNTVLMTVTSVLSTTANVGLAEFQAYGVCVGCSSTTTSTTTSPTTSPTTLPVTTRADLALNATATATSSAPSQGPEKAIDGIVGGYTTSGGDYTTEWASVGGGAGTTFTLTWSSAISINQIVLYDRPNLNDQILGGTVTFSDKSTVTIGNLNNNGTANTYSFTTKSQITSLTLLITSVSSTTSNIGLSEIQVYGPSSSSSTSTITATATSTSTKTTAGTSTTTTSTNTAATATSTSSSNVDLAMLASITASSSATNGQQGPEKAIDGIIGGYTTSGGNYTTEWASNAGGAGTTLTLTWATPITINQIVLYDRPNLDDQILGGTLTFSDQSTVTVGTLNNDGTANSYPINVKSQITSLTLLITSVSSTTSNIGLSEIQVYGPAANSTLTTTTTTQTATTTTNPSTGTKTTTTTNTATTTTTTGTKTSTTTASASTATSTPSGTDLAMSASVSASSSASSGQQGPEKAIDGVIGGYTTSGGDPTKEWATDHQGVGATLTLTWASPVLVNQVYLYDRPNLDDQVTGGTLTFSDGSTVLVPSLPNDASSAAVLTFATKSTTSILFTVTSVSSTTSNVGLSEILVYGPSSSSTTTTATATTTTSTTVSTSSTTTKPTTSSTTTSSKTTSSPTTTTKASTTTATTTKASTTTTTTTKPTTTNTKTTTSTTTTKTTTIPTTTTTTTVKTTTTTSAKATTTTTASKTTTTTTTTSTTTTTIPVSSPTGTNYALLATATSSTSASNGQQGPEKAIDGVIGGYTTFGGDYTKEWASDHEGVGANLTLTWATSVSVTQVYLYDRPNLDDQVTGGTLKFSDGTTLLVPSLPNAGTIAASITFATKAITSLTFTVTSVSSTTSNIGLSEIQVYGP